MFVLNSDRINSNSRGFCKKGVQRPVKNFIFRSTSILFISFSRPQQWIPVWDIEKGLSYYASFAET